MSRVGMVALVLVAVGAMWLAVGWPSADKPEVAVAGDQEPVAIPTTPKPRAQVPALRMAPDAAVAAADQAEPADDEAASEPAAAPASKDQSDFLPGERGPVDDYQALYDRSARDAAAHEIESSIKTAFSKSSRPDLLHSSSCREHVCKVLIRWSPDRMRDYVASMRGLALGMAWPPGQAGFESQIAITTASQKDKDGGRLVELLIKRRAAGAAKPTFAGGEKRH